MHSLYSVALSSPGLEAPTLTVEALTSRIIGLNWQVSDRCVTSHVTCCLATSDHHVATSDCHVATSGPLRVFSSPITYFSTECIRQRKNLMFVMHHLGTLSDRQRVL